MSIQFLCPACNQPIEIDGEFGGSAVGCPYCRKTVTAPRESTLQMATGSLAAKPIGGHPGLPTAYAASPAVPSRNVVAIVAFFFSILTVFFFSIFAVNAARNPAELQRLQLDVETWQQKSVSKSSQELQQDLTDMMEGWPDWVWVMLGGMCASVPCGLTALICGIVGVCRPRRRGWAIAALVLLFVGLAVLCFLPALFVSTPPDGVTPSSQPIEETEVGSTAVDTGKK